jgi:putative phosphoesterase
MARETGRHDSTAGVKSKGRRPHSSLAQPRTAAAPRSGATLVGLISDTHGLIRPEAADALRGSALIVHAGDVGSPAVMTRLRALAPLRVVRGNIDRGAWADRLAHTITMEVAGRSFLVLHDIARLTLDPAAAGIAVVVHGHSHRPSIETRDGVLLVNPGSAGPRRFTLPVTVARLAITDAGIEARIFELQA